MFIIPKAIIAGYGRIPTIQYKCLNCNSLFFPEDKLNPFCEKCSKIKIIWDRFPKESEFHIEIIDYIQKTPASFKRRSKYNYKKIYKRDNYTCQYCYYSPRYCFENVKFHIDHVVPWSHGGNNSLENLKLSCEWCNLRLSNFIFNSYFDKKVYISELRKEAKLPFTERQWRKKYGIYIGDIVNFN